ncbi:MAG: hypothetical protein K6A63_00585 [Acholeplasmatales bacterium]|nr:hypothetical protein [Acholeplasmatales bacterium]
MDVKEFVISDIKKIKKLNNDIKLETLIEELNFDSIEIVELMMDLEDEYDINLDFDVLVTFNRVIDIIFYIEKRL